MRLRSRISLEPEEVLASKSRIKILTALAVKGSLNISGIKKYTGLNYKSIARALEVLKYIRVVGESDLNRTRSFRIRVENERACAVGRLIRSLGGIVGTSREGRKRVEASHATEARAPLIVRYKEPRVLAYIVE